jgi:hypothetical protein
VTFQAGNPHLAKFCPMTGSVLSNCDPDKKVDTPAITFGSSGEGGVTGKGLAMDLQEEARGDVTLVQNEATDTGANYDVPF